MNLEPEPRNLRTPAPPNLSRVCLPNPIDEVADGGPALNRFVVDKLKTADKGRCLPRRRRIAAMHDPAIELNRRLIAEREAEQVHRADRERHTRPNRHAPEADFEDRHR